MNEHLPLLKRSKSSWLYPIYVPSAFRAGSAPLLEMLNDAPAAIQKRVHVVVLPFEKRIYQHAYPWATVVSEPQKGIGPARMRCLIDAEARGYENIVVLDDDIIHLSLLEETYKDNGERYAKRVSSKVSGIAEPMLLVRSLAVSCRMAQAVFDLREDASYGAARNALFSGPVADPSIGAMLNKQSFPACVMFFSVARYRMREMPKPFHFHGEDLAMFLDNLSDGNRAFQLPAVAYDQHGSIDTTIPLDPMDEVGRPHLEYTEGFYPDVHKYLRVSVRNKLGGVMRIGVNWNRYYKDTGTGPDIISMPELIKQVKESI
ncbi:glycosyltransferase [Microbacterium phage Finny]|uniref:Glycosyltransferase n=1 Tax=Microbacterium phage Finny TaxID=2590878 RepID=A0A4Y6ECR9_9CAUD|nr:glycosyltransferase [Microbacterium phage Finny]